jgi:hypothetical protein
LYRDKIAAARAEGRQESQQKMMLSLLVKRFGVLLVEIRGQIMLLSFDQLNSLGEVLWDLQSLADLLLWLNSRGVNE